MSKLYEAYKYCKKNNKEENTLFLFKVGVFYLFIDKDAVIASNILKLKLTKLNDTILKCGFPIASLNKYYNYFTSIDKLKI